jgi:hypothetical protein
MFRSCILTAEPGVQGIFLGWPWRAYAGVVFLNAITGPHIDPASWREWQAGEMTYLDAVNYAESGSIGPAASRQAHETHTHFLTSAEADRYRPAGLPGSDASNPGTVS